ncbi:MAG TPA: hypothetical protein VKA48_10905 [Gammaproteobacteria bacterium]|nr:hypothetical protein [Gammaproteobacteria bacterium]
MVATLTISSTRLSGIRQGLALATILVSSVLLYQVSSGVARYRLMLSLQQGMLGAIFIVLALEQRGRYGKWLTLLLGLVGLFNIAVGVYAFPG